MAHVHVGWLGWCRFNLDVYDYVVIRIICRIWPDLWVARPLELVAVWLPFEMTSSRGPATLLGRRRLSRWGLAFGYLL